MVLGYEVPVPMDPTQEWINRNDIRQDASKYKNKYVTSGKRHLFLNLSAFLFQKTMTSSMFGC